MMKKSIIVLALIFSCFSNHYAQEPNSLTYATNLLVQADSMPVGSGQLIALPHQGLFIVDDHTFYSLDQDRCTDIKKFRLLENVPFDKVIVNDNEFIVKSQQFLLLLGEKQTEILTELDTDDYTIFPGNDSIINIVTQEGVDVCTWYKYDRRTGEIECILRQTEPIRKIVAGNHIDFCIIGNNIYYVKDNLCGEFAASKQPVLDMVLVPDGLMFCTDNMLSLIRNDCVIPLVKGDFQGLHYDGKVVYILLKNGNIS